MTLEAARINKRFTQVEAAKALGITADTLGRYESGKSYPRVTTIKKIEALYEIEYKDIIFLPLNCG
ncbi:MAG: helix-turn-helix domain-containing protein [Spirochaetia bacterium]|nr:helix-turn-helix domain-containing protein [Spirochaetia bacterium]